MASARDNRKATAAGVAAALLLAGFGSVRAETVAEEILTTGHTTFAEAGTTFDPCFAGIAGALMQRVVWFNGMTLFSRTESGGNTWIYAMELFTDQNGDGFDDETGIELFDPTEEVLYETGRVYDFPDENEPAVRWVVTEYYALRGVIDLGRIPFPPSPGDVGGGGPADVRVYVWVVKVADQAITDFTIGRDYNFVSVVDTCKYHIEAMGDVRHTDGDDSDPSQPAGQHNPDDVPPGEQPGTHPHNTFATGLWVGGEPKSIPLPADPDPEDPLGDAGGGGP